jgi:hypothetical protein
MVGVTAFRVSAASPVLAGAVKGSFGQVTARYDEKMPFWPSDEGGQEG